MGTPPQPAHRSKQGAAQKQVATQAALGGTRLPTSGCEGAQWRSTGRDADVPGQRRHTTQPGEVLTKGECTFSNHRPVGISQRGAAGTDMLLYLIRGSLSCPLHISEQSWFRLTHLCNTWAPLLSR